MLSFPVWHVQRVLSQINVCNSLLLGIDKIMIGKLCTMIGLLPFIRDLGMQIFNTGKCPN